MKVLDSVLVTPIGDDWEEGELYSFLFNELDNEKLETEIKEVDTALILAAPDMLKACKLILMLSKGRGCAPDELVNLAPKTREQLERAIAKASYG